MAPIRRIDLEIGGKIAVELVKELDAKKIIISDHALDLLLSEYFTVSKFKEQIDLVRLTVKDLGFPNEATTEEIYKKAEELGLELCPAEVGPNLQLKYSDQPLNERVRIAMKQISARPDSPSVFYLVRSASGLQLDADWVESDDPWHFGSVFVFALRKLKNLKT